MPQGFLPRILCIIIIHILTVCLNSVANFNFSLSISMFPLHTQGGMSSVFSLYFSINFSSPCLCCCGLIHSLYFPSRKEKNHYLIWNIAVPWKKTGKAQSRYQYDRFKWKPDDSLAWENCRNTPVVAPVGLFRGEGGPKESVGGLGASLPLQGSIVISPVVVALQRKVLSPGVLSINTRR